MKKIFLWASFLTTLFIFFTFLSFKGNYNNYILVTPKIKNIGVPIKNVGDYILTDSSNNYEFPHKDHGLFGHIFLDVPAGQYNLSIKENPLKSIEKVIKNTAGKIIYEDIDFNIFNLDESGSFNTILNTITFSILLTNCVIFFRIKKYIEKDISLSIIFFLLVIKICLTLRGEFQNILIFDYYDIDSINIIISKIIGFLMCYYIITNYVLSNIAKSIFFILLLAIFLNNLMFFFGVLDFSYFAYLLKNYPLTMKISSTFGRNLDMSKLILLMFTFKIYSFRNKINYRSFLAWNGILVTLFLLEYSVYILSNFVNGYYFIELMEFIALYWVIIFYKIKFYNKKMKIIARILVSLVIAYFVLFYFNSPKQALGVLLITLLLELYTFIINNLTHENKIDLEHIYNNLSLVDSLESFQEQLTFQIRKYTKINFLEVIIFKYEEEFFQIIKEEKKNQIFFSKEDILINGYNMAFKITFASSKHIGVILIDDNSSTPLTLEELNFLMELCKKISPIANRLRLNSIYKELN